MFAKVASEQYPGSGKCGPNQPQPKCPGSNCYALNQVCYYACCQGPTPITNPLSCATLAISRFGLCAYVLELEMDC